MVKVWFGNWLALITYFCDLSRKQLKMYVLWLNKEKKKRLLNIKTFVPIRAEKSGGWGMRPTNTFSNRLERKWRKLEVRSTQFLQSQDWRIKSMKLILHPLSILVAPFGAVGIKTFIINFTMYLVNWDTYLPYNFVMPHSFFFLRMVVQLYWKTR